VIESSETNLQFASEKSRACDIEVRKERMNPQALYKIFEWFTTVELLIARAIVFVLFVVGIFTVAYFIYQHGGAQEDRSE
jgi:hypothetical protein